MKKITVLTLAFLIFISTFSPAFCAIDSTKESTAEDAVYIAGNADLYPLEYYNNKTKRYEGILPEIYAVISEQTGIEFSYVAANGEDRQKQLAENYQVEIVSAYNKGDITTSKEIELFSYQKDGVSETVCIGFTKIVNPDVAQAVETALANADKGSFLSAAMALESRREPFVTVIILAASIFVLIIAIVLLVLYILKKRKATIANDHTKTTDVLTGIGNLKYFEDCFANHVSDEMRPLYYVSYIAIDIEKIETYFGSLESEELQRYAANTITSSLKDSDFAARIDNGVFAVCFMCPDDERAQSTMLELVNKLNSRSESYAVENGVVFRCGIYSLDKQNTPLETTVYYARQGYIFAQDENKTLCLCDESIINKISFKNRLRKKILSAIENKEFNIYLQFVLDTTKNTFSGAEVLSRWHSLEEGVLSPANYIDDLKRAGMIDRLDFYIFEKTCEILSKWKNTDYNNLYLSCNFTRTTLSLPDFSEKFENIISKYDFDRNNLVIEITEDSLVGDSAVAYKNILDIKTHGSRIALDDFGSGYTSFGDLCDYPIDVIKIDRQIVTKSLSDRGNAVLVSIIQMAHALGIHVLCEGVETEKENENVRNANCDLIQGFLYSRVLPYENALEFYKSKTAAI